MKPKKTLIFLSAIVTLFFVVFIIGYEEPRIIVYNSEGKTHDNVESPIDLTVLVNGEEVYKDSIEASPLPQANLEVEFRFGQNHITAYSNKANLFDEWVGFYSWDNRFEIYIHRTRFEDVDVTRLQILDY